MDYKKAYEKMVQRARELHKGGNALTKKQMEIVCPELAESEDERVNEEIRNFLIDMECKRGWISYLEKQKEQKPAEWSEEDEDMLNSCISSIEEAKENRYAYKETDGDTSYDYEIDWLKSLRPQPHWKPSEEQMEALEYFVQKHKAEANAATCVWQDYENLVSLRNDLKKL